MSKKKPCGLDYCPQEEIVGAYASCTACAWGNDGDCKYCDEWKDDDDNYITVYHDGNFYCGYGERKEAE